MLYNHCKIGSYSAVNLHYILWFSVDCFYSIVNDPADPWDQGQILLDSTLTPSNEKTALALRGLLFS